ncbi:helix-turn-helix domain-containing protein [Bacillus pseudomycoides]|uniref:helix-turn-helix domain-containing protein n=1 Tax=Bacillus pseudomycoides TaxID=64104 RepID=UPI000BEFFA1D|nr:helix-turn-helix domain-containing protein [Bacillus pseudomycoides]PEI44614.1 hypothetical protein CN641_15910 [Bacillus pseudomycoides]PFY13890.1 hypothetical protein COL42_20480 [Bacillus pseudomycoides]
MPILLKKGMDNMKGKGHLTHALELLVLLANNGQLTGQEISSYLQITDRHVRKLANSIKDANIPIKAKRGRAGGYSLDTKDHPELAALLAIARYVSKESKIT